MVLFWRLVLLQPAVGVGNQVVMAGQQKANVIQQHGLLVHAQAEIAFFCHDNGGHGAYFFFNITIRIATAPVLHLRL